VPLLHHGYCCCAWPCTATSIPSSAWHSRFYYRLAGILPAVRALHLCITVNLWPACAVGLPGAERLRHLPFTTYATRACCACYLLQTCAGEPRAPAADDAWTYATRIPSLPLLSA